MTKSGRAPIVVVGAGAAGLMAAAFARQRGRPVVLLERTSDGGRKILISGGGRCNVLPSTAAPDRFVSDASAALVRRMLGAWPLHEQRRYLEDTLRLPLALEPATGKLFPASNRARDVRDQLRAHAAACGVTFQGQTTVTDVRPVAQIEADQSDARWHVQTSTGPVTARSVILATGGLSVPQTGSDGSGLTMARGLGQVIVTPYPALTPLCGPAPGQAALAGISLPVRMRARSSAGSAESSGGFLFTHRGYSGPSVLDVSHVATRTASRGDAVVRVQWTSRRDHEWDADLGQATGRILTVIAQHLPERLAAALCADAGVPLERRGAELRRSERRALVERLTSCVLPWTGHEGFAKAEVTGGGVALGEVQTTTLESRRHPGLYLCGELLDAFGPIGGHNFAWAWSTGRTAGLAAAGS